LSCYNNNIYVVSSKYKTREKNLSSSRISMRCDAINRVWIEKNMNLFMEISQAIISPCFYILCGCRLASSLQSPILNEKASHNPDINVKRGYYNRKEISEIFTSIEWMEKRKREWIEMLITTFFTFNINPSSRNIWYMMRVRE
jgi:hypothetical protein